jgi:hypothetical protein
MTTASKVLKATKAVQNFLSDMMFMKRNSADTDF